VLGKVVPDGAGSGGAERKLIRFIPWRDVSAVGTLLGPLNFLECQRGDLECPV
jgi:hypothetical protein